MSNTYRLKSLITVASNAALIGASISAIAATPAIAKKKCGADEVGGIVKEVKVAGGNTVMSFVGSTLTIKIPNSQPQAKELAAVKPGALHCIVNDEDI